MNARCRLDGLPVSFYSVGADLALARGDLPSSAMRALRRFVERAVGG